MPSRRQTPCAPQTDKADQLSESVDHLSSEVGCLRQVLDELREDISWITRNGLPVQPIEHVDVRRMARDVNADNWNERLVVERTMIHPPGQLSALGSPNIERIAEELRNAVETLAQEHLEPVLTALDETRDALLSAIHRTKQESGGETLCDNSDEAQDVLIPVGEHNATVQLAAIPDIPAVVLSESENPDEAELRTVVNGSPENETDAPDSNDDDLREARIAQYEQWCRQVRDPAVEHSEGWRTIATANDGACVEYQIAQLPVGNWAVHWRYGYRCGNYDGVGNPWTTFPTRPECLQKVLLTARQFFSNQTSDAVQQVPRRAMLRLLRVGLFAFIEPDPVLTDPDRRVNRRG